jgi:hypothetical protein
LTDKKFRGYLDRLRENLEVVDEAIVNARKMSKGKGKAEKAAALQWAKTLRDFVELRGTTLANIKAHMNGRDETGVVHEPPDLYDENPQVEFERCFRNLMTPWTPNDLKLKCEDCGVESEDVSHHDFQEIRDSHYNMVAEAEDADLCPKCVEKRSADRSARYERWKAEKAAKSTEPTQPARPVQITQSAEATRLSQILGELKKSLPPVDPERDEGA